MLMYFIYLLTIRFYLLFVFGVSEVLIQTHLFFIKWHASAFLRIIFVKMAVFFLKWWRGMAGKTVRTAVAGPVNLLHKQKSSIYTQLRLLEITYFCKL